MDIDKVEENVGEVMEAMDMVADAETIQWWTGLFSQEALLHYAGISIKICMILVMVFLARIVIGKVIGKVIRNRITIGLAQRSQHLEEKRLHTIEKLMKSIVGYVLYFIALISCLDMVGISVTTIIAGAGILSLAVAYGAQSIVQDLISGLFIIMENQYSVGEWVSINGNFGHVVEIGMKTTKIVNLENEMIIMSNGNIQTVINYSRAAQRKYVDVSIAYEANLDEAWKALQTGCDRAAEDPSCKEYFKEKPNIMGVQDLADSAVLVRVTFTAVEFKQLALARALRKHLKLALDEAHVEISYNKIQLVGPKFDGDREWLSPEEMEVR